MYVSFGIVGAAVRTLKGWIAVMYHALVLQAPKLDVQTEHAIPAEHHDRRILEILHVAELNQLHKYMQL